MRLRARLGTAAVLASAVLLAACGQKAGVTGFAGGQPGQSGSGQSGEAGDGRQGALGDAPATGENGAPESSGDGAREQAGGSAETTGNGGDGAAGGGNGGSGPGDTTGVTDDAITIGIHAPVTGAAAFPQESFRDGVGVYAEYINDQVGIHGRDLEVIFRDDGFDPNQARSVCREMAEEEEVFLLIGGGGSDQIDACARYAETVGVPYLSAGVHEERPGLGSIATDAFYALSLTYEQQIPLITDLIDSDHSGSDVALLVGDNDSLNSFYQEAESELDANTSLVHAQRVPKDTGARDAPEIGRRICASGADVAVWNASPSGLINVSKSMTCTVTWMGPGNTNGLDIVATGGCPQIEGAQYYSSFPGTDKIDEMDPNYTPSYRQKNNSEPDDIGVALWGIEKMVAQIAEAAGEDLSRESFTATLESGDTFDNGVYPAVRFNGDTRFGGTAMHLREARCGSDPEFITTRLNVSP
ncbi:ABC transporter substrate-binding protein [Haloechinothrix sp. YIM 98757]|uniref:ABC transporter substrate-binding protein n=1 Tax=Haloechinothrix aidingensis TaxID=2752311 RepID=A0A838A7S0_9PSEU|nr:ABC transporter substrate-binding protein [Haloechinothrix aidingensis]MBA0126090.1 ABC transporter substrate-binding protein [Haloechinothrix aidingensis]